MAPAKAPSCLNLHTEKIQMGAISMEFFLVIISLVSNNLGAHRKRIHIMCIETVVNQAVYKKHCIGTFLVTALNTIW